MNITKRTKSEGTTVYQFRVFLSQSADGKQRTRSKTWQPPAGMTAKAAEKEAKRQAVIFENEVKQGRAALDVCCEIFSIEENWGKRRGEGTPPYGWGRVRCGFLMCGTAGRGVVG